jgi:hypothetical protein
LNTVFFEVLREIKEPAKVRKSAKSGHLKKWAKIKDYKIYSYIFTVFVVFCGKIGQG